MKKIAYITAVALAIFSGSVSAYGLTKFAPGAEWVILIMAALFEAGKLTAFGMMHQRMNVFLKAALLVVGLVLMSLNIVGVSGFLSNAYEQEQTKARAISHTNETEAKAIVTTLERQLRAAEARVSEATAAMGKARGDRDQIKAVKNMIEVASSERDRLSKELAAAQRTQAKAEGASIQATGEFAAIAFIAAASGMKEDRVAHLVILVISSLPDILAVLLIVAAGYTQEEKKQPEVEVTEEAPALIEAEKSKPNRREAAMRGWETRRRKQAELKDYGFRKYGLVANNA